MARYAWTASDAIRTMKAEADRHLPNETGGLLMGYEAPSRIAVVITMIVGPGPNAVHQTHRFIPDYDHHEREVARIHASTGAGTRYLGDWHSHPGGTLSISPADRTTLRRIALSSEAAAPEPLMGILARPAGAGEWKFGVFQASVAGRWWALPRLRTRALAVVTYEKLPEQP